VKLIQLSLLYRLSNLNLESLATALSNKNGPKAKEIQSGMKQEVVDCLLKTKVFYTPSIIIFPQDIICNIYVLISLLFLNM
jgi:hypothetical protein